MLGENRVDGSKMAPTPWVEIQVVIVLRDVDG